jgi:hypothetical protein
VCSEDERTSCVNEQVGFDVDVAAGDCPVVHGCLSASP